MPKKYRKLPFTAHVDTSLFLHLPSARFLYVNHSSFFKVLFKGAITQLQTVTNGFLHAKSGYQWHCIQTTSTEDIKTVKEITSAQYIQLSCSLLKCWSLKNNAGQYIASEVSAKGDCTMGNLPKVILSYLFRTHLSAGKLFAFLWLSYTFDISDFFIHLF